MSLPSQRWPRFCRGIPWLLALSSLLTSEVAIGRAKKKGPKKAVDVDAEKTAEAPEVKPISLAEVLDLAAKNAPQVQARRAAESAATAGIGIAKSGYLPTASVQGVDSAGFPASTGYLGLGGLVGSPFRSGAAAGLVAEQPIYDFGRTAAQVAVAEKDTETKRQETRIEAEKAQIGALKLFVECARLRSEAVLFRDLEEEAKVVAREVKTFVNTGQRSVVDRYLSESQVEEAAMSAAAAEARLGQQQRVLGLAIGLPSGVSACPTLNASAEWTVPAETVDQNPYVAASAASLETERARKEAIRAAYRPTINLVGALGWMEKARLVSKDPYAVGIGINVPVFNGFKDDYELEQNDALINARQSDVDTRKLEVAETNGRFDQELADAAARMEHLKRQQTLALKAFKVAKQRYFAAEGDLTDLRESIKNLSRANEEYNDALAISVNATGAKALFNGATLTSSK